MAIDRALVSPHILRWARERDHVSLEVAAQRSDASPERLASWEAGIERPTFQQARKLAHGLRVPFGYLFLSHPPREMSPLPDLRTVAGEPVRAPSPELRDLLHDALEKQQWMKEFLEEESQETLPFVGRYSLDDEPEVVAADITATLGVNDDLRERARRADFLSLLAARAEDAGAIVMRSGVVESDSHRPLDVAEFRGFAISDPLAPLVFVNTSDARTAQIFTLLHELAHLWLGQSGISNLSYSTPQATANAVERLCNRIAAEVLLPREQFLARWIRDQPLASNLRQLSAAFRVSELAVLRQAFDHDLIPTTAYRRTYTQVMSRAKRAVPPPNKGGDFYNTLLARNSRTLTTTLLSALTEGRVSHRDAARLLNIPIGTLDGVSQRVLGGGAGAGG